MSRSNIVLTGFMGTGKSAVGRWLASETDRRFIDTDTLIEQDTGRSVADIFARDGEAAFRAMEARVAKELSTATDLVIATGGRMALDPINALHLARGGVIICLTAEPEEILARLAAEDNRRPLLQGPDPAGQVHRLLAERQAGYGQFPQVDTSAKPLAEVAAEVLALVEEQIGGGWPGQPPISRIPVSYPGGGYQVAVGWGLLADTARWPPLAGRPAIISDSHVAPLYAARLAHLQPLATITFPAGEAFKTLDTVSGLYPQLLESGLDRQGAVVSLGGGVVGDTAGFVAATYMRGVSLVQCPTTLLAMVDASIGGKTGVDLPQGKNLVGVFKQPLAVMADLETLATLPAPEFTAGMAEVVKHGLIANRDLFERLESGAIGRDRAPSPFDLQLLVVEAILVKRQVVESDPFEAGRRKILNLGHTFGHAIEQVSGYRILHGQAVALGLVAAADLSAALGYCPADLPQRVRATLVRQGLPVWLPPEVAPEALLPAMGSDKKKAAGRLNFVLLREVGDVFVTDQVPVEAVGQVLDRLAPRST